MGKKGDGSDTLQDRRNLPIFIHSELDDMELSPNAFRVYAHLARRAGQNNKAFPSYQSIGDHCFGKVFDKPGTRRRRAMEAVKELVEAGLVAKTARKNDDGGNGSNVYELTPSYEWDSMITSDSGAIAPPSAENEPETGGGSAISTPLVLKAPKGTPTEGTEHLHPADAGNKKIESQKMFGALCWLTFAHKNHRLLTNEQRGALNQAEKLLRDEGITVDDLRTWYRDVWRKTWPGNTEQRPSLAQIRAGVGVLHAEPSEFDDEPKNAPTVVVKKGEDDEW